MPAAASSISNRRAHLRKDLRASVQCKFRTEVVFPGFDQLMRSRWTCIDLGQGGMLLEARESGAGDHQSFEWLQNSVFTKGKGKAPSRVYYPALPPEKMSVSVEIYFPKKKNSFTFHGALAWFRHMSKGIYRMGVRFDEGQDIHIYQDRDGQLVIAALWRESDLSK